MNDLGCAFEYFNKCRENLVPYNIIILLSFSSSQYLRISTKIKYIYTARRSLRRSSLSVVEFFFTLSASTCKLFNHNETRSVLKLFNNYLFGLSRVFYLPALSRTQTHTSFARNTHLTHEIYYIIIYIINLYVIIILGDCPSKRSTIEKRITLGHAHFFAFVS